jgi:hypothetical protein
MRLGEAASQRRMREMEKEKEKDFLSMVFSAKRR